VDNNSLSQDLVSESSFVSGPAPDAIAEFRVETNAMSAEYGRSGGAVLNVNIKSGTNGLHGTAYEFLRNSAMDAKNYYDPGDKDIPPFKQNQFGFSIGGPVVLPKIYNGRDKTFFFGDYQGTRIRSSETFLASVPTEEWRTGNFSGFQTIYDPQTTTQNPDGTFTRQPQPFCPLHQETNQPDTRTVREALGIDIGQVVRSHAWECKRYVLRDSRTPSQDPAGATPP
jgi:hypothetical protein